MKVVDGSVVEMSVVSDSLTLAEQIGAVEPLAPKACQIYDRDTLSSSRR